MQDFLSKLGSAFGRGGRALDRPLALLFVVAAVALRIWDPVPVQTLRLKTFDFYQLMSPWTAPTDSAVVIVDVDEESLADFGQWPWPRSLIADLVDRLTEAGVVAIGFDITFPEPDRLSAPSVARSLKNLEPRIEQFLSGLPGNDAILAQSMENSRVVLGQSGLERRKVGQGITIKRAPISELGQNPRPYIFEYPGLVRNIPVLEEAAAGLGMINLNPEPDGTARRVASVLRVDDVLLPTLSLELLRVGSGGKAITLKTDENGIKSFTLPGLEVPTDEHGRLWVHFAPHDRSRYISASDILSGDVPAERLTGKLMLVGTSAVGLQDLKTTPLQTMVPGVEVHALLIENIIARHYLSRPSYAIGAEIFVILLASLVFIIFVPLWGAIRTLVVGFAGGVLFVATGLYLYLQEAVLIDMTFPMLATFAVYCVLAYLNYIREEAQKRQIREAFSHYMSPALVEQLAKNPDKLKLGGETKELSLLFCDIRGFTAISEQYDAAGLTRVINRFLTPMTGIILDHHGTIDKYIGDCIMAFWNAPLDDPDHAARACNAALSMLKELESLNETWRAEAAAGGDIFTPIRIGIGLNSGLCAVGNMGSEQRFDYSVLGDDVNLAARLEGQTKAYNVDIIIGAHTQERAEQFAVIELDFVRLKGKTTPARIFALLGGPDEAVTAGFRALVERQEDFLAAYRDQDWQRAERLLSDCEAAASKWRGAGCLSGLYTMYRDRITGFRATPPGPGWDGVYTALIK